MFDDFCVEIVNAVQTKFTQDPKTNIYYSRLLPKQFDIVEGMLKQANGKVLTGGLDSIDKKDNYVPPTVIRTTLSDPLVQADDEIFGPILLIVPVSSIQEAIAEINSKPEPLAVYIYTLDKSVRAKILQQTQSGSAAINEALFQVFGSESFVSGFGNSGLGGAVGKESGFNTLTHERLVLDASQTLTKMLRSSNEEDLVGTKFRRWYTFMMSGIDVMPFWAKWLMQLGKTSLNVALIAAKACCVAFCIFGFYEFFNRDRLEQR